MEPGELILGGSVVALLLGCRALVRKRLQKSAAKRHRHLHDKPR